MRLIYNADEQRVTKLPRRRFSPEWRCLIRSVDWKLSATSKCAGISFEDDKMDYTQLSPNHSTALNYTLYTNKHNEYMHARAVHSIYTFKRKNRFRKWSFALRLPAFEAKNCIQVLLLYIHLSYIPDWTTAHTYITWSVIKRNKPQSTIYWASFFCKINYKQEYTIVHL